MLFDAQRRWIDWAIERWKERRPGLTEKSREVGVSWLAIATATGLCTTHNGMVVGFGSRTEDDVDKADDPDCLFWKAREFTANLPVEFRAGFDRNRTSSHMLLNFPATGSTIKGDAGRNIGRGGRAGLYFVDESAHLDHPISVDAALSQTTTCRIDISTPKGMDNPFATKRFGGKISVFTISWRDDPRKDDAWYAVQQEILDPVTLAQEVDLDYTASVEGVIIPNAWAQAAVDAHVKLGLSISGHSYGAFDVADEGLDKNAFCAGQGFLVSHISEWSGKGSDIFASTQRAFMLCDQLGLEGFYYDADGLGADVRGNARIINESRGHDDKREVTAFRGSEGVLRPEHRDPSTGRKNIDFFENRKAQAWWDLRHRFMVTHRWVVEGRPCAVEDIISIASTAGGDKGLGGLISEISQPTFALSKLGRIMVNKKPEGMASPNKADALMIRFSGVRRLPMRISSATLARAKRRR